MKVIIDLNVLCLVLSVLSFVMMIVMGICFYKLSTSVEKQIGAMQSAANNNYRDTDRYVNAFANDINNQLDRLKIEFDNRIRDLNNSNQSHFNTIYNQVSDLEETINDFEIVE